MELSRQIQIQEVITEFLCLERDNIFTAKISSQQFFFSNYAPSKIISKPLTRTIEFNKFKQKNFNNSKDFLDSFGWIPLIKIAWTLITRKMDNKWCRSFRKCGDRYRIFILCLSYLALTLSWGRWNWLTSINCWCFKVFSILITGSFSNNYKNSTRTLLDNFKL